MLFPGGSSEPAELTSWYIGLKLAGIEAAIDIVSWGDPGNSLKNVTDARSARESASKQAQRLLDYMQTHPGRPITVIGYSAGAAIAVFTVESLPPDQPVDRVVLMSADLSPDYDLSAMLERTRDGAINYWSPLDVQSLALVANIGTLDGGRVPAALTNFAQTDARLTAMQWNPLMVFYGNFGGHLDYLFNAGFIRDFLAPLVVTQAP